MRGSDDRRSVQQLIEDLQGMLDMDGVEGVDPETKVCVALSADGAFLLFEAMSGEQILYLLDAEPATITEADS